MKKSLVVLLVFVLIISVFAYAKIASAQSNDKDIRLRTFVHHPKEPGRPTPVSNCAPTVNDQVNNWGLAGWQMPFPGMDYRINYGSKPKNLTDTAVFGAVSDSFSAWSVADTNQIFTYVGSTSVKTAKYDGTNAILWKGISGSALAITYAWYTPNTGELIEADTVFNKNYKWSVTDPTAGDCAGSAGTYDVRNIGTHEFGHWIGLDDLYSPADEDLTMYGYGETTELKKDSLGLGDISGVRAIAP